MITAFIFLLSCVSSALVYSIPGSNTGPNSFSLKSFWNSLTTKSFSFSRQTQHKLTHKPVPSKDTPLKSPTQSIGESTSNRGSSNDDASLNSRPQYVNSKTRVPETGIGADPKSPSKEPREIQSVPSSTYESFPPIKDIPSKQNPLTPIQQKSLSSFGSSKEAPLLSPAQSTNSITPKLERSVFKPWHDPESGLTFFPPIGSTGSNIPKSSSIQQKSMQSSLVVSSKESDPSKALPLSTGGSVALRSRSKSEAAIIYPKRKKGERRLSDPGYVSLSDLLTRPILSKGQKDSLDHALATSIFK